MSAAEFLKQLPQAFNPEAAGDTECVLQFNTSTPAYATIKNGECTITEGTADNADVTLIMEDDDLIQLFKGELNGMTAFMTGKLQVEGDMMLGQRLQGFFDGSKLS